MTTPNRHPLRTVAQQVSAVAAIIGGAVSTAAGIGAITVEQNEALQAVLAGTSGLVTALTATLVAFGVVRRGEPHTTPLSDPRDDAGRLLLPAGTPQ